MFIIDTQSKTPIFEQLKKQILEFISIGIFVAEDKLPSVRSLASELGINPNTVAKTYAELEEQGYIYTEKGKGCFVSKHDTGKVIQQHKEDAFQVVVEEMKLFGIKKERLIHVIENVYKEEGRI